jgi:hypothetical protein|tara:strand:- start:6944 stop:7132 length:189 start_codon:yes stop_codon:yes gene_type:complete
LEENILAAGIRFNNQWALPMDRANLEAFLEVNTRIGGGVSAFVEATATLDDVAAMAGLKVRW